MLKLLQLYTVRFWLGVGVAIISIVVFVVLLNWLFLIPVAQAVMAVGSLSTAVGVFLAFLTLRNTHEWNRRHYTIEFSDDWNECARKHLNVLERQFPELFAVPDFIEKPDLMNCWCLNRRTAEQLVTIQSESQGTSPDQLDIREHLIELLNYFEGIVTAYEQHVVDRAAIEESVGTVILDVCIYFQPFIEEMRKINRRDPWPPLSRVVELWLTEATRRKTQAQAAEATLRHGEALKKFQSKLKERTGI